MQGYISLNAMLQSAGMYRDHGVILTDWYDVDKKCPGIHASYGCLKAVLNGCDEWVILVLRLDPIRAVD